MTVLLVPLGVTLAAWAWERGTDIRTGPNAAFFFYVPLVAVGFGLLIAGMELTFG